ncbi:MAG: glycosyltransferase family 87 protein [Chloroflexota bacterium]
MDEATRAVLQRRHVLAFGLAVIAVLFLVFALLKTLDGLGWGYDFEAYFQAALRLARQQPGESIYVSYTLDGPFSPGPPGLYLYAPPLAVAVLPFTMLSVPAATIAFFVLRVLLLALACGVMPVSRTIRLVVFAVAAFSFPVLQDLVLGNVSVLVVVAMAFAWRWLDRPVGSIASAIAISVRPTLGVLLLWWAVRRRWRPLGWALGAGVVLIVLTLPFVGSRAYTDYLTMLRNVSQVTGVTNNLDLASTVLRFNVVPLVATLALYAGYAIAIVAMVASLRYDRDLSFMVTIGGSLLLAPLLWDHYLAGLLLPAAFLAQRGRTWGLALPLLGWLPAPLLPLVAIVGTLVPFLAEARPGIDQPALDPRPIRLPWRPRPVALAPAPVPVAAAAVSSVGPGPEAEEPPVAAPVTAAHAASAAPVSASASVTPQLEAAPPIGSNTTSSPG